MIRGLSEAKWQQRQEKVTEPDIWLQWMRRGRGSAGTRSLLRLMVRLKLVQTGPQGPARHVVFCWNLQAHNSSGSRVEVKAKTFLRMGGAKINLKIST